MCSDDVEKEVGDVEDVCDILVMMDRLYYEFRKPIKSWL